MAQGGLVVASRLDSEQGVAKYAEPGWASVMGGGTLENPSVGEPLPSTGTAEQPPARSGSGA